MPNHMNPDRLAKRCVMLMRLAGKDSLGLMGSARYRYGAVTGSILSYPPPAHPTIFDRRFIFRIISYGIYRE